MTATRKAEVRQGVTLDVLGERPSVAPRDGLAEAKGGWTDFTGYWKALGEKGVSMNVISEVSYYQIREVIGTSTTSRPRRQPRSSA